MLVSSPHAWGCFQTSSSTLTALQVFPTCVGVFLKTPHYAGFSLCLPHMRGGVSKNPALCGVLFMSSPHAWGCFEETAKLDQLIRVFPTCVGVFPQRAGRSPACPRLPHMRGGVSGARTRAAVRWASSPHAWGCFQLREEVRIVRHVFPTCVGVFPGLTRCILTRTRLPHMRGGVSYVCGAGEG